MSRRYIIACDVCGREFSDASGVNTFKRSWVVADDTNRAVTIMLNLCTLVVMKNRNGIAGRTERAADVCEPCTVKGLREAAHELLAAALELAKTRE